MCTFVHGFGLFSCTFFVETLRVLQKEEQLKTLGQNRIEMVKAGLCDTFS